MRTPQLLRMTWGVALAAVLAGGLFAQKPWHEDNRKGYKIKVPSKWSAVPVDQDEKWIVAKYISNRTYNPKKSNFIVDHRPAMRVIIFSDEAKKVKGPRVLRETGNTRVVSAAEVPYQDYRDYLKRNMAGFFFSKEKTGKKVAGIMVDQYEVKVEKTVTAPMRLISWVFHAEDAEYAVEFEVLEDHYRKLQRDCYRALKTFRFIEREGGALTAGTTGQGGPADIDVFITPEDREKWKARSAADRKKHRKNTEERRLLRAEQSLPEGWRVKKTKHFVILSHADAKYTSAVASAAEACRGWLEERLGDISDEYAYKCIIRVCADMAEADLYATGSRGSFDPTKDRELVIYKDVSEGKKGGFEWLFRAITRRFLLDKDQLLYRYMPPWIENGLMQYVGTAKPDGKSLDFDSDTWEDRAIRDAKRKGDLHGARHMMEMTAREMSGGSWTLTQSQFGRLVRYFEGPGKGRKPFKNLLVRYMKHTIEVAEVLWSEKPKVRAGADTEEEEEARYRQEQQSAKKRARDIINGVHEKLGWDATVWEMLEKGYEQVL